MDKKERANSLSPGWRNFIKITCIIFSAVCFLVAFRSAIYFYEMLYAFQAPSWPYVEGEVVSSRIAEHTDFSPEGGEGIFYSLDIRYIYEVNRKQYQGNRISFVHSMSEEAYRGLDKYLWCKNKIKGYPVGKKINVFYKPTNPKISVLVMKIELRWTVALLLFWLFCGIIFLFFGFRILSLSRIKIKNNIYG